MALTFTPISISKDSGRRLNIFSVTFDSSYAVGGETITANNLGLSAIDGIFPNQPTGGRVVLWDSTAGTLKTMVSGSSAGAVLSESTAGTDLSAVSAIVLAIGV